ncbi:MAG: hypothetical protein JW743_06920 [Deltaproteobacteria bacterium]|nr:hypothetical protein [Deltaproteobacteria bacterium]MBN2844803.1 hypothetical protein [Deltaproteobacteria bacterium]
MTVVQPKGEKMRQAIKWISSKIQDDDGTPISKLIMKAGQEFNLSPMESEFLTNFYKEDKDKEA